MAERIKKNNERKKKCKAKERRKSTKVESTKKK